MMGSWRGEVWVTVGVTTGFINTVWLWPYDSFSVVAEF